MNYNQTLSEIKTMLKIFHHSKRIRSAYYVGILAFVLWSQNESILAIVKHIIE